MKKASGEKQDEKVRETGRVSNA
jgi:hypothetical protein